MTTTCQIASFDYKACKGFRLVLITPILKQTVPQISQSAQGLHLQQAAIPAQINLSVSVRARIASLFRSNAQSARRLLTTEENRIKLY